MGIVMPNTTQTSAMSTRNPLGLFLKVGGNNESRAKWTVWPAVLAPSTEMKKLLLLSGADAVGLRLRVICFQVVVVPRI